MVWNYFTLAKYRLRWLYEITTDNRLYCISHDAMWLSLQLAPALVMDIMDAKILLDNNNCLLLAVLSVMNLQLLPVMLLSSAFATCQLEYSITECLRYQAAVSPAWRAALVQTYICVEFWFDALAGVGALAFSPATSLHQSNAQLTTEPSTRPWVLCLVSCASMHCTLRSGCRWLSSVSSPLVAEAELLKHVEIPSPSSHFVTAMFARLGWFTGAQAFLTLIVNVQNKAWYLS